MSRASSLSVSAVKAVRHKTSTGGHSDLTKGRIAAEHGW